MKRNKKEATNLCSVAGLLTSEIALVNTHPFRSPHHTVSTTVLGGRVPRPGEFSLAHHGGLFLDDNCAFAPDVQNPSFPPAISAIDELHSLLRAAGVASLVVEPGITNT